MNVLLGQSGALLGSKSGSPLYVNLGNVCSGSNPIWSGTKTWGDVYPCNLNAGSIVSAGVLFSLTAVVVGAVLHMLLLRWPKGDETQAWGARMNKLSTLIKRGGAALFSSMAMYTMGLAIFVFLLILVIFSSRAASDATDGIRVAAGYIIAVVLCLGIVLISVNNAGEAFTRAARSAMQMGGVSGSLRTAYSSGSVSGMLTIGFVLFFMCVYYLFMSLGRSRDAYSQYGNKCNLAGVFCGQTLGWRETTGFVYGVTTVTIMVRGMAGIFAKAAEVGSELIFKLEPDQAADPSRNPASIADQTGAVSVDAAAMLMDLIETVLFIVFAAEVLAQGHAPRMALPIWCMSATVVSGLAAYGFVRCSNAQVATVGERYRNMMWGLRIALYVCAIVNIFVFAIATGILYRGYPSRFGGEKEGWYFFSCLLLGDIASLFVWEANSYFTATATSPTRSVAAAGITGAATMFIQGTGVGLISLLPTGLVLMLLIISCGAIAGQYGIAMGALGFVSVAWFVVAVACLAPVTYNADESCNQSETAGVRETTVSLFLCGESCASESRAWSSAAAVLAGFSILAAFKQEAGLGALMMGGTESDSASEGIMFACAVAGALTPLFVAGINVLAIGKGPALLRRFKMATMEIFSKRLANPLRKYRFWDAEMKAAVAACGELMDIAGEIVQRYKERNTEEQIRQDTGIMAHILRTPYPSDKARNADVVTMLLAGHDTTGFSVAWILVELARNPNILRKLRAELDAVNPKMLPWTLEMLKNTPYQDSVIKETFRLWPASALGPTLRSPDRDIDIGGGKVLPKGCIIACVPKPALRMGIADPDSFIPERWSDPGNPDLEALEQMSHMPFGAGKRVCIGQNLANAEIRMVIFLHPTHSPHMKLHILYQTRSTKRTRII
uniref:H(+)-exporting diphosphatase n=1 Tax=Hemiselmis andersenii TaxID=464988 RepID=A0A7S1E2X2_HEMAN|mmetsp:Transcript_34656/g.84363  ORF Transcript_34656/g.84363 Transcript_34656/m.84363 type:complete len:898 (+) Transcript_34656:58-2751(+)